MAAKDTVSPLTEADIRRVVKAEIAQSKWDDYIWSVLTRSDFEARIRSIIADKLPGSVSKEVREYLSDHLKDKVRSLIAEALPSLVEVEVLKRLRQDSGLQQTLHQYTLAVNDDISNMRQTFAKELAARIAEIYSVRDIEIKAYRQQAQKISKDIVDGLVGTNGAVLTGFKEELARSAEQRFQELRLSSERRLTELEHSLSFQTWINVSLVLLSATYVLFSSVINSHH